MSISVANVKLARFFQCFLWVSWWQKETLGLPTGKPKAMRFTRVNS